MDGHVIVKDARYITSRRCWMAEAEADVGFGYVEMLVSGKTPAGILGHLKEQYRRVTVSPAARHHFKETVRHDRHTTEAGPKEASSQR